MEQDTKNKVEAVLFASGRAMEEQTIQDLTKLAQEQIKQALSELQADYKSRPGALFIWNENTKWKINVYEAYSELVKTLAAETELARPTMATLALIASRSPVLQSEVIQSRGDGAYAHIAELVDKEFVTKEKFGRSFKLKLADKFYNYFDVHTDQQIQEVFKDVKPTIPEKIGEMDVIEAETDDEAELEKQRRLVQVEIYDIKQQREQDKGYLNEFENRLGEVSKHIDVAEEEFEEQKYKYQPTEPPEEEGYQPSQAPSEEPTKKELDPQELAARINKEVDELIKEEKDIKKQKNS